MATKRGDRSIDSTEPEQKQSRSSYTESERGEILSRLRRARELEFYRNNSATWDNDRYVARLKERELHMYKHGGDIRSSYGRFQYHTGDRRLHPYRKTDLVATHQRFGTDAIKVVTCHFTRVAYNHQMLTQTSPDTKVYVIHPFLINDMRMLDFGQMLMYSMDGYERYQVLDLTHKSFNFNRKDTVAYAWMNNRAKVPLNMETRNYDKIDMQYIFDSNGQFKDAGATYPTGDLTKLFKKKTVWDRDMLPSFHYKYTTHPHPQYDWIDATAGMEAKQNMFDLIKFFIGTDKDLEVGIRKMVEDPKRMLISADTGNPSKDYAPTALVVGAECHYTKEEFIDESKAGNVGISHVMTHLEWTETVTMRMLAKMPSCPVLN